FGEELEAGTITVTATPYPKGAPGLIPGKCGGASALPGETIRPVSDIWIVGDDPLPVRHMSVHVDGHAVTAQGCYLVGDEGLGDRRKAVSEHCDLHGVIAHEERLPEARLRTICGLHFRRPACRRAQA